MNGRERAAPPGPNNFEVGLWELKVHGSRFPGLQPRGEKKEKSLRRVKGVRSRPPHGN